MKIIRDKPLVGFAIPKVSYTSLQMFGYDVVENLLLCWVILHDLLSRDLVLRGLES